MPSLSHRNGARDLALAALAALAACLALAHVALAGRSSESSPTPRERLGRQGCVAPGPHARCRLGPNTGILSGPAAPVALGAGVILSFASNRPDSRFQCRLDSARWKLCRSPQRLPRVGPGRHTFLVRARSGERAFDHSPAALAFEVVGAAAGAPPPGPTAPPTEPGGEPVGDPRGVEPSFDEEAPAGASEEEPPTSEEGESPDSTEAPPEAEGEPDEEASVAPPAGPTPRSRLFAADSIWTAPLAPEAVVDPASPRMISRLLGQIEAEQAGGGGPTLGLWSRASLYEVGTEQPRVPVYLDTGPWGDGLAARLRAGVPVPAEARPAPGRDQSMAIWQPETDSYWEFFHMEQTLHAPQFSRLASVGGECPLPSGTYSYKLTSLNARGETTAGTPPQKVRVPPGGSCIRIYWSPIAGASSYRVYKARGDSSLALLTDVGGSQTNFLDDGTRPTQGTAPPSVNTAATPGEWHATYGGFLAEASKGPGYYRDEWDAAGNLVQQWGWGAAATGMPLAGGMVTKEDVERGEIDHALSLGLINSRTNSLLRAGAFAFPAQRSDGRSTDPSSIPEGARLVLDPELDLEGLELSPLARMLAEAAQRYGMIVHDGSMGTTIYAEDPSPYVARGEENFYRPLIGSNSTRAMRGFPWSSLRVVQMHLCTRGPCTPS